MLSGNIRNQFLLKLAENEEFLRELAENRDAVQLFNEPLSRIRKDTKQ